MWSIYVPPYGSWRAFLPSAHCISQRPSRARCAPRDGEKGSPVGIFGTHLLCKFHVSQLDLLLLCILLHTKNLVILFVIDLQFSEAGDGRCKRELSASESRGEVLLARKRWRRTGRRPRGEEKNAPRHGACHRRAYHQACHQAFPQSLGSRPCGRKGYHLRTCWE